MPNRILKESICRSDQIDSLSMLAEICFYRLIVNADDYGRFDGRPAILKSAMFPLKEISTGEITQAMCELIDAELVECYTADGKPYLMLTGWDKHQQQRAKKSKYPAPDVICNHLISPDINGNQQLISNEIKRKQMIANVPVIQSESEYESNPEAGVESRRAPEQAAAVADHVDVGTVEVYLANNITGLNATLMQEFQSFKDDLPEELIRHAIDEACAQNIRSYSYVRKILNRYVDKGFKSLGDVLVDKAVFERNKQAKTAPIQPPKFNYQQHGYSEADYQDIFYDPTKDFGGRT